MNRTACYNLLKRLTAAWVCRKTGKHKAATFRHTPVTSLAWWAAPASARSTRLEIWVQVRVSHSLIQHTRSVTSGMAFACDISKTAGKSPSTENFDLKRHAGISDGNNSERLVDKFPGWSLDESVWPVGVADDLRVARRHGLTGFPSAELWDGAVLKVDKVEEGCCCGRDDRGRAARQHQFSESTIETWTKVPRPPTPGREGADDRPT